MSAELDLGFEHLAGLLDRALNVTQYRPGYAAALRDTGLDGFVAGGIWPDAAVTPEQLGTVAPNAGGDPALFPGAR